MATPLNIKHYRAHLYRWKEHPGSEPCEGFTDSRDSFIPLYISFIPFICLEYFAESRIAFLPAGLVFPLGYLLFWAFYYTFYKPGLLEDRLVTQKTGESNGIFSVLIGFCILFVKVIGIEFSYWVLRSLLGKKTIYQKERPVSSVKWSTERRQAARHGTRFFRVAPRGTEGPQLPRDILNALATLGLGQTRDWHQIHSRYRDLAKRFHPDLNREITDIGRRFMRYDAAYRKLESVKSTYFQRPR